MGHSFSKELHERLFCLSGDDTAVYTLIETPMINADKEWEKLASLDGFNVTLPHKLTAYKKVDNCALSARKCGSVNTVKREKDGTLTGYNTDVVGFMRSIASLPHGLSENVLLLGCGGVAHMMAAKTAEAGGNLTVAVKGEALRKAETMADSLRLLSSDCRVRVVRIDRIPEGKYDIMLQATSCGMYPETEAMPVEESVLDNVGCLFDAVYRPAETLLMKKAKQKGIPAVGGLPMLVYQAAAAHKIWDGVEYSDEELSCIIDEFSEK